MGSDKLPAEVGRSVKLFLNAIDELAPGLVTGFYLVGSVALGDFRPRGAGRGRLTTASDIDFVVVTKQRLAGESPEMKALSEAHARTVAAFPRPNFDGVVLTWADLAAGPSRCPDVPCAQENRFTPAGRSGVNPVTFCELAWHGITIRGPQPTEFDLWADRNTLHEFTIENLRAYWRPWWHQNQQRRPLPLIIGLSAWFPVWAVLGVSRLHHLLATGTMTSKSGAGRYAQEVFDPRWQPIIAESLYLRTNGTEGHRSYRSPLARRHDTLAFVDSTIDSALARPT
ncbi:hypothetical protein [Nocardia sp. NPDC057272]|uniref:hypothetical protein n=1 Tax=Nocardia sp. NPDC057272 TaxID=3346079 RepID=UPI00362AE47D